MQVCSYTTQIPCCNYKASCSRICMCIMLDMYLNVTRLQHHGHVEGWILRQLCKSPAQPMLLLSAGPGLLLSSGVSWCISSVPQIEPQSTGCSSITDVSDNRSNTPVQHGDICCRYRHGQQVSPEGPFLERNQQDLLVIASVKVHGQVALRQHSIIHEVGNGDPICVRYMSKQVVRSFNLARHQPGILVPGVCMIADHHQVPALPNA